MTEADRRSPDGKVPRQNPQEIPVAKSYIGYLVRDYISHQRHSNVLEELFRNGLPNEAKPKQPEDKTNLTQDLRDVLFSLLETYNFWGETLRKKPRSDRSSSYQPYYQHQGLPHLDLITLKHTLPSVENPTIRFKKTKDESIVVKAVDSQDVGARGFLPDFWMASEYLVVNFDGRVKLAAKYWPGTDKNGVERQYFKSHPLFPNSLLVLKSLVTIALNGAMLQQDGQLYQKEESVNSRGVKLKKVTVKPRIFT